jgi:hypothetical protein
MVMAPVSDKTMRISGLNLQKVIGPGFSTPNPSILNQEFWPRKLRTRNQWTAYAEEEVIE